METPNKERIWLVLTIASVIAALLALWNQFRRNE